MRTRSQSKRKTSVMTRGQISDYPSPLHIIKRTKTVEFRPSSKRETSNCSVDYGPDRPLIVMKKRLPRGSVTKTCENQVCQAEPTCEIGELTPRAVNTSSIQKQSKLQSRFSWFSRQRTSSSGTTCRRYHLRDCSISSNGSLMRESPGSECFEEAYLEPSEYRSSMQIDTSIPSTPASAHYNDDCHILVPRISITPEVQTSINGISAVWAAIEISVQLSRPYTDITLDPHADDNLVLSSPLRAGSASRFGYIYDLAVDVLPAPRSTIIKIIQANKKACLGLGSTLLVLAKIQVDCRRSQPVRSMAQRSDELIADIEKQLGAAMSTYLQVRLRYCHSGFAAPNCIAPIEGVANCETRLETTVNGIIDQHVLRSSLGLPRAGSSGSSVFGIVASYWGPVRANEIFFRRPLRQGNSTIGHSTTLVDKHYTNITERNDKKLWTGRQLGQFTPPTQTQTDIPDSSPDQEDPAHKIWTAMRRRSSLSRPIMRAGNVEKVAAAEAMNVSEKAATVTGSTRLKSAVDWQRDMIRDVALRNKRSIGADSLKSLVPSMMSLEIGGKEAFGDSYRASDKENVPPCRRKESRWSFGSWW
ncbi:hypothetical protein GGS21DRAFT_224975 [Xylaria nigripes]|nr:hypothetical protein GGS21DRAFT_224975 [Xylaria nigripes]